MLNTLQQSVLSTLVMQGAPYEAAWKAVMHLPHGLPFDRALAIADASLRRLHVMQPRMATAERENVSLRKLAASA